jgi:hypothetical protein
MVELTKIMDPILKFTDKLQSNDPTISLMFPGLKNLQSFIEVKNFLLKFKV